MMMMMMMMFATGGRLDTVYDRRTEEILQCHEKTRIQEATKTDTKAQGKNHFIMLCSKCDIHLFMHLFLYKVITLRHSYVWHIEANA